MKEYIQIFKDADLRFGECFGSKSSYRKLNKDNYVVFNARIYTEKIFKKYKNTKIKDFFDGQALEIWYGDIDFNKDINKFRNVAYKLNEPIIITNEMGKQLLTIYPY